MKTYALASYRDGGILSWHEKELPTAQPGQVVVKVQAAGINPLDRMIASGQLKLLLPYKLPHVMGNELAGVITEVGSGVTGFTVGEQIFARPRINAIGAFAEYLALDAADIAPMPANLTFEEAASLPLVLLTAVQAFTEKVSLSPGDKVFIQGGAGGLGSIAIQVAKYLGAQVATTVSGANVDLSKQLGADVVIDYRTQKYEDYLQDYDYVLDTVGKAETVRSMAVLRPGGTVVSVAGSPDKDLAATLGRPHLAPLTWLMGTSTKRAAKRLGVNYTFLFMHASGQQLATFGKVIEEGKIKPLVGHVFPFDQIAQALELAASGKANPGKIVVSLT